MTKCADNYSYDNTRQAFIVDVWRDRSRLSSASVTSSVRVKKPGLRPNSVYCMEDLHLSVHESRHQKIIIVM